MYQLIAKWKPGEGPLRDEPSYFAWVDGRPATREDFEAHRKDTREYREGEEGVELWIDFVTVGDVAFDATSRRWWLFLPNGAPVALDLDKRAASDRAISWALADLDVLYRVRIHRERRAFRLPRRRRRGTGTAWPGWGLSRF